MIVAKYTSVRRRAAMRLTTLLAGLACPLSGFHTASRGAEPKGSRVAGFDQPVAVGGAKTVHGSELGMDLILISPGRFCMGTPRSVRPLYNNEWAVDVTLTRPFYLGKTEVTQQQWQAVMGTAPWNGKRMIREGDDYPATHISWDDAQEFCRKLSAREQRRYRLPTEAEWEYACRAGATTRFPWGDWDGAPLGEYAWYDENAWEANERYPHRVAQKKPNALGLHDMHGNVWEWCEDVYYWKLPGGADPLVTEGGALRVNRGGGWATGDDDCGSTRRFANVPWFGDGVLGFRVALAIDAPPTAVKQSKAKPPSPARAK